MKGYFWYLDKTRIVDSTRHSKPDKKLSRKKRKAIQNCKGLKVFAFRRFMPYLPPTIRSVINQKTLPVASHWMPSCGTCMKIPVFVADEQQSA
ncbi:hypothetical protein TNCV_4892031 [Trichonephila clavipes]|nr:hypothetical protein TNCV_4892031 [Trichonephila clavipes]